MNNHKITDKEHQEILNMVDVLILVSMVDRYFIDFKSKIEASGRFRHRLKYDVNRCEKLIIEESNRAWQVFNSNDNEVARGYTYTCDDIDAKMSKHILLQGDDRETIILGSILELIEELIQPVSKQTLANFDDILAIKKILKPHFELTPNKAIKFIISTALRSRLLEITK